MRTKEEILEEIKKREEEMLEWDDWDWRKEELKYEIKDLKKELEQLLENSNEQN